MSGSRLKQLLFTLGASLSMMLAAFILLGVDLVLLSGERPDTDVGPTATLAVAVAAGAACLLLVGWPRLLVRRLGSEFGFPISRCRGCRRQYRPWNFRCPECGRLLPLTGALALLATGYGIGLGLTLCRLLGR